jgi:hypothetical protein
MSTSTVDDLTESKRFEIIITQSIFCLVDVTAVGLRFLSRYLAAAPLWWDDWFCLFLLCITLPYNIFGALLTIVGQGRHSAALPDHGLKFARWVFGEILWYTFNLAMFKYAILLLYLRVFPQRWLRPFVVGLAGFIAIWLITIQLVYLFQCRPVHAAWDVSTPGKRCLDTKSIYVGQSVPTIFFDLVLLALPPFLVWRVRLPAMSKATVLIMFLLCGLVTVASVVRLALILEAEIVDTSWNFTTLGLWSAAEPCLGLLCASIPTYGLLVKSAKTRLSGARRKGSSRDPRFGPRSEERSRELMGAMRHAQDSMDVELVSLLLTT